MVEGPLTPGIGTLALSCIGPLGAVCDRTIPEMRGWRRSQSASSCVPFVQHEPLFGCRNIVAQAALRVHEGQMKICSENSFKGNVDRQDFIPFPACFSPSGQSVAEETFIQFSD